jgi:hypothetical protein
VEGDHEKAEQAKQQLPDKAGPEEHQSLLQQFGINPQELISSCRQTNGRGGE